jgi:hypothetical protein
VKHLYWIICGVLLLAIVITWLLIVPTDEARSSKQKLDQQSKDLKELEARAERGDPPGVFDAANPDDTKRLASEFLITEQWKRVLQEKHEKYQKQLTDIKAQLLARGAWLRRTVAPTKNQLEWYNEYIKTSEALLLRLREAGCMRRAGPDELQSAGGESPSAVRQTIGLYTKSGSFPDPKEHPQLTTRLRTVELIANRLIEARIAVADNPQIGPTGRSDERARSGAVVNAIEWVGGGAPDLGGVRPLVTSLSNQLQVRAIGLRLTLDGSLSALLSASAQLERNAEPDRPLVAITSATVSRRETAAAGERYDVADDAVRMVLAIEVIEFAEPTDGTTQQTGQPGMPGNPPAEAFIYGAQ